MGKQGRMARMAPALGVMWQCAPGPWLGAWWRKTGIRDTWVQGPRRLKGRTEKQWGPCAGVGPGRCATSVW